MAHNYAAWIIICSGRAQNSVKSLEAISLGHPNDSDINPTLAFFQNTDADCSLLADDMAGIEHDTPPHTGSLNRAEKLLFWGGRAEQAIKGMSDTALYFASIAGVESIPAQQIVDLLEKIEEDATKLTMAVATRH